MNRLTLGAALLLATLCRAFEHEDAGLLQVRKGAAASNTSANASATIWANFSDNVPNYALENLKKLTEEEWDLSHRALVCAYTTYAHASSHLAAKCGRVLKEVEGRESDGSDFMLARLIRSEDGKFSGKCWVAFRGTNNDPGWNANVQAFLGPAQAFSWTALVAVPVSWKRCYDLLQPGLRAAIQEAYSKGDCDPEETYYVGHSLGGVLANYAALDQLADKDGKRPKYVITAGAPRPWIASGPQCRALRQGLPRQFRFVRFQAGKEMTLADSIPNLPPSFEIHDWIPAFRHCAALNLGLWMDAAKASKCKSGESPYSDHCHLLEILAGVQSLGVNEPMAHHGEGDWELHGPVEYSQMVGAGKTLFEELPF